MYVNFDPMIARWSKKPYNAFDIHQAIGDLKRVKAKMDNASENMDRVRSRHKYSRWKRKFGTYFTKYMAILRYINTYAFILRGDGNVYYTKIKKENKDGM